jgi:hypothetical protein
MKRCALWLLAIALGGTLPAAGAALDWSGRAGTQYRRMDAWNPGGERQTSPHLDLNLGLDASGFLFAPETLRLNGGVEYRRTRDDFGAATADRNAFTYRLRSSLFPDARSPVTVNANASRIADDLSTGGSRGTETVRTTTFGADARVSRLTLPHLQLGYGYVDTERSDRVYGSSGSTIHSLWGIAMHGDSAFSYTAQYRGNFSDGTFDSDNYGDHRVDVNAQATLAPDVTLRLDDTFFLRLPTTSSQFNVRQEVNSLSATLIQLGKGGNVGIGGYNYSHGLQSAPLTEDAESGRQSLSYGMQRTLSAPEWRVRGDASVSYSEERLGETGQRGTGETLTITALWRRSSGGRQLELRGGPSIGATQPAGSPSLFGHGAKAGATLGSDAGLPSWQLSYDASYESDLNGTEGWSVRQDLSASADGTLAGGSLRGSLSASALRRQTALFGAGASRSLVANAGYRVGRYDLQLQASLHSAVSGTVAGGIGSDGLFLPAPYDTQTLSGSLTGSVALNRYVFAGAQFRYSSTDIPDRPSRSDAEARGSLELRYASLNLGLENRYVISEVPGGTLRFNQVMVKAYRTFGLAR